MYVQLPNRTSVAAFTDRLKRQPSAPDYVIQGGIVDFNGHDVSLAVVQAAENLGGFWVLTKSKCAKE